MARCLNSYHWAEEPLNEEFPYQSDDIIVEDSEIDESPCTKAERNRRREVIGRRYLLGHVPLVQTASLRGPFGGKSGWVAPWGRIKACIKDKGPSGSTRNHNVDTNAHEAIDGESENLAIKKSIESPIKEELLDRCIDDDAVRYDADNEDDTFEVMNDDECDLLHSVQYLDGTRTKHTYLSRGEPRPRNSDDDISDASEKDFQRVIRRNGSKDSGRAGNDFLQNDRKRKVDTGWLRGVNVLKRSRYELFEHSSPTPVAGAICEGNRGLQRRTSLQTSDLDTLHGRERSQALPIPYNYNHAAQLESTNKTSTLPADFGDLDDTSFDATEESTQAFLMPNDQIVAADCVGLIHNALGQHDIHGLLQASRPQPILIQSSGKQQVDIVELAPSNLDVEDFRPLSSARRLSRQVRLTSSEGDGKVSDNLVHGLSVISDVIAYEGISLSNLDGKVDFRDTPSPASEASFYYRRTSRKSQGRKPSPCPQKGQEEAGAAGKDFGILERNALALQPTDAFLYHSINLVSSGNARGLKIQKNNTSGRSKKDGRYQHRSRSPVGSLDALSKLDAISSPDPLSEDFKDGRQQQITPDMDQGLEKNPDNSSHDNIVAADCQRIMVAEVSPTSHQQAGRIQQSVLRGLSQLSTSKVSGDHVEISIDSNCSVQGRLSDSHDKGLILLAEAENMDETILAQGYHLNGGLSSQPKSSEINNISTSLPHVLQQLGVLATRPIRFKGNTEPSQPLDSGRRVDSTANSTPTHVNSQVLEEPARLAQSPWTAVGVESLRPGLSSDPRSHGSQCQLDNNVTSHHLRDLPIDETGSAALSSKVEDQTIIDGDDRDGEDSFEPFKSLFKHSEQFSDELGQSAPRFPSTQTLVDAATANPWNSAFKKPRRCKSDKRVSFGPPPSNGGEAASDAPSNPLERMGSPPPPTGTLRLTQLDDPFHHRLKATRDLEVTEESLTKFMNTPWDDIPAIKPSAKLPLYSPAVAAMAEAFIAADQQNLHEKFNIKDRSKSARTKPTESFIQPQVWIAHDQAELRSSSPLDASFSIAPSGKVTAVSIEAPGYDAEDNLQAVLEDMGGFLEGWDVESELKKAKGHKFEKGNDIKVPRKREYLSGISNR
jgi:hypothetical protein